MMASAKAKCALRLVLAGALLASVELLAPDDALAQLCSDGTTTFTKTDSPDPVAPGGTLTYTINMNLGTTTGSNGAVGDPVPAQTSFVSMTGPGGWSCSVLFGTPTCTNAGSFSGLQTFTMVVSVAPTATGTITNTADAAFTSAGQVTCAATATTIAGAVPALPAVAAVLLGLLLLATGVWFSRRRSASA